MPLGLLAQQAPMPVVVVAALRGCWLRMCPCPCPHLLPVPSLVPVPVALPARRPLPAHTPLLPVPVPLRAAVPVWEASRGPGHWTQAQAFRLALVQILALPLPVARAQHDRSAHRQPSD